MADQQSTSAYHRGAEHERQKIEENQTTPINATADEVEAKTLTNIYYDCLERIFDFLDLKSLLNVAGTCKRLQIAATAKFGDNLSKKRFYLYKTYPNEDALRLPEIHSFRNYIGIPIIGLKFIFPFLRCFGSKILDLSIDYRDFTDTQCNHLHRYIGQYCAGTLTSISFQSKHLFSDEDNSRTLKSIESVHIHDSNLENQLPNFVNWFPNLHKLSMIGIRNYDESAMAVGFPHLEHLQIQFGNPPHFLSMKSAKKLLHANRQLKSLLITSFPDPTLAEILELIEENQIISKLRISDIENINAVELNRFISKHQSIEELEFTYSLIEVDEALMLIRQLNSLKRFEFKLKNHSEWDRLQNQLDGKWKRFLSTENGNGCVYIELNC